MATRHALLIGVPHYDDDDFNEPRLADAVRSDVAAMRAALDQSGYAITDCPPSNLEKAAEEIFGASPEEIPAKAAWLRQRLKIYAPLFSLELDALSPELEALSSDLDPPGEVLVVN